MPTATQGLAKPLVSAAGTGSAALSATDGILRGYSVRETAAAVAVVRLRDGSVGGTILATISLAASASETRLLPNVVVAGGVFVERVSGTTEVVVYS